jgi:hypothetical protein
MWRKDTRQIPHHYSTVPVQYGRRFIYVSKMGICKKLSEPGILGGIVPISTRANILDTISKTGNIPLCFFCEEMNRSIS